MKRLSPRQRFAALIFLGSALLIAGAVFMSWTQASNKGDIGQPAAPESRYVIEGKQSFDGRYMSFDYSRQYMVSQKDANGDDLELYQFDAAKPYPKKIAVSVSDLPDGTLYSNSAYLLRTSHTDKFYQRELPSNPIDAEIWSSTDGTKQTVFITMNGRAAVLAFTQDGGDKTLYNQEVDEIVGSFKWK